MIYLDTAATSHKKPPQVYNTLAVLTKKHSANAGRGASTLSLAAANYIYEAAEQAALLFHIAQPENIAFTCNTTLALNMAIKGCTKNKPHVIMTSMEHNSAARPVYACGAPYTIVRADREGCINPIDIARAIRPNTGLIVVNHASNVCGSLQDIAAIGKIARQNGILFLVDSAQSAGVVPIDVETMQIDMLAFAGHKSLMGPLGTGGLYVREGLLLDTIIEGGSGSSSESKEQPDFMPDRLVSGTANMPAIAALGEGIKYVRKIGVESILAHERALAKQFVDGVRQIGGITLYGGAPERGVGVVSLNIKGKSAVETAQILDQEYKIAVRSGLHCAPLAHETLGTLNHGGTVRFSFGHYTTRSEVDRALLALNKICKKV